jgi:hypothetical protein
MSYRITIGLVLCVAATFLGGCAPGTQTDTAQASLQPGETSIPGDTPIGLPTLSPAPLTALTPAVVLEPAILPPSPTYAPPVVGLPDEKLFFYYPGPNSQITSPVQLSGWGGPSRDDFVTVRLYGEDGRLLAERDINLFVYPGNAGRFVGDLEFEIEALAETGRLEVFTIDPQSGAVNHRSSVHLILLSTGDARIHPAMEGAEQLTILNPPNNVLVEDGSIVVQGAGWTFSEQPLSIVLYNTRGEIVGTAEAELEAPEPGLVGVFETTLEYDIPRRTWGLLTVNEYDENHEFIIHTSSVILLMNP